MNGFRSAADLHHRFPAFAKLIVDLGERIGVDGESRIVAARLEQARTQMEQERLRWLKSQILLETAKRIRSDCRSLGHSVSQGPSGASNPLGRFSQLLTLAESLEYVHCEPTPLGLTAEDLCSAMADGVDHASQAARVHDAVVQSIEDHIQRQCDTLHRLVPHARAEPELAKPPATADFALAIETLAAARESLSEELHGAVDEQVQWAIASTHASGAALAAAAELFAPTEVRRRFELERIKHSWLIMHCETLLCKLALLDVQFKAETYSQQKVKALHVIAEIAQAGLADARRARSDVRRTLDGYEAVGPGFNSLVEQYRTLLEELHHKQWALGEVLRK